jgi:hypothetical protein
LILMGAAFKRVPIGMKDVNKTTVCVWSVRVGLQGLHAYADGELWFVK